MHALCLYTSAILRYETVIDYSIVAGSRPYKAMFALPLEDFQSFLQYESLTLTNTFGKNCHFLTKSVIYAIRRGQVTN